MARRLISRAVTAQVLALNVSAVVSNSVNPRMLAAGSVLVSGFRMPTLTLVFPLLLNAGPRGRWWCTIRLMAQLPQLSASDDGPAG
jgi:hypothetical protein